jgi:hypothetical protein
MPVAHTNAFHAFSTAVFVACVVVLVGPAAARAQGISVSAVAIAAQHPLIGEPLAGGAVSARLALHDPRVALHLEAANARSRANRVGSACAGLIRPGTCAAEPLRDEARLTSVSGGALLHVLRRRHALVALTADLTLGAVRADTRGLASGDMLRATKTLWGGLIGVQASWTPVVRVPIALEIGGGIGALVPLTRDDVLDGYTPFEQTFGIRRVRVGVAWQPFR